MKQAITLSLKPLAKPTDIQLQIPQPGSTQFNEVAARILTELISKCSLAMSEADSSDLDNPGPVQVLLSTFPGGEIESENPQNFTLQIRKIDTLKVSHISDKHPVDSMEVNQESDFLTNVFHIIEDNFENPHFQIADLASELYISRTKLYRKLKAKTGKTFTLIQRDLKVKRIRELLTSTDLTISEISYRLGFKDPSYMSRIFKKVHKISPSHFQARYFERE